MFRWFGCLMFSGVFCGYRCFVGLVWVGVVVF